jgi:2-dehydropantoate 2-reductase
MNKIFPDIKRICVFGVGGVGGYFGGKIAEAIEHRQLPDRQVYFIARGKHLQAIKEHGLTVKTPERTFTARPTVLTADAGKNPPPDLILLCVKSYDLDQAVSSLKPLVNSSTIIIPLLNGIDIPERIRQILKAGIVLPACLYLGTHIESSGIINQSGGNGVIIFGRDKKYPDYSGENVKAFFEKSGIKYDWRDDPQPPIWEKYLFIAAFGLVSAYLGKSLGEIMEKAESRDTVKAIMEEIYAISKAKSVQLTENIVEKSLKKAFDFPFDARTSFQRDIESKARFNEGDLYGGTIIREGQTLGIPVPVTTRVYQQITGG